jgi:hypothetical protein
MSQAETPSSPVDASSFQYIVGVDIGSQTCCFCALKPDKSQALKPMEFPNDTVGFTMVHEKLEHLGVPPNQILIGLEATSPDARKSLSFSGKSGVSALSVASASNPSVCASRVA